MIKLYLFLTIFNNSINIAYILNAVNVLVSLRLMPNFYCIAENLS